MLINSLAASSQHKNGVACSESRQRNGGGITLASAGGGGVF